MLAIGTEGHGEDGVNMVVKIFELFARRNIPQFHHLVVAAGSNDLPIRAPGNGVDAVLMALHGLKELMRLEIPYLDLARALRRATARGQHFSVRPEGNGTHVVGVTGERGNLFAGRGIDEAHLAITAYGKQFPIWSPLQGSHRR